MRSATTGSTRIPSRRSKDPISPALLAPASIEQEQAYDVKSSYFLVTVRARQGTSQANARALLKRGAGSWPTVVWQTLE